MPAVAGTGQCPACGGRLPDRDRTRGGRRPQYCSGACRARAYRARRQDGQPPGAGTPPPTAASRHARAVEIRQQVHELTGILADTASGQQALFATPGTTHRARPAAQAGRTLHRLIAELTMLAATASVTKRATKRRPPTGAPQEAPLFEDPDPAAT